MLTKVVKGIREVGFDFLLLVRARTVACH